jgi:hypothetical protein
MKSTLKIFLLVTFLILVPTKASAQGCQGVMTPAYSTYNTLSMSHTTSTVYLNSNVVVDGTTYIVASRYCNLSGAYHRGVVTNILNGVGGQLWGPEITPSGYISVTNPQEFIWTGIIYANTTVGEVLCSFLGALFNITHARKLEAAWTKEESLETESNCFWLNGPLSIMNCNIDSVPLCTVATTPPDAHNSPTTWQVYPTSAPLTWWSVAGCERPIDPKTGANLGPWICTHSFAYPDDTYTLGVCTHDP